MLDSAFNQTIEQTFRQLLQPAPVQSDCVFVRHLFSFDTLKRKIV
jgi:hypothetical protein